MAATNYSPSAKTIAATVTHPVDGDDINNDNLYKEASPGGTPKLTLAYLADCIAGATKAHTRSVAPIFFVDILGTPSTTYSTCSVLANKVCAQAMDLPHGGTLSSVTFYVDPANATPPAGVKLIGKVYKRSLSTGTETQIGVDTTDPTTSTSYGAAHSFSVSGASEVIDRTAYTYHCLLVGETGTGAAGANWYGTTYTTT